MPHIVVEYAGLDLPEGLIEALTEAMAAHPEVPETAVKLRAYRADSFRLLSGETAFINVTLRLIKPWTKAPKSYLTSLKAPKVRQRQM